MVKDLQANQENTNLVKSSWAKDYIILIIGFCLIILSSFSDLNKTTESGELIITEENVSSQTPVMVKTLSELLK